MLTISDEDYDTLELKIHTEIQKIFVQFISDLEKRKTGPGKTATAQEQRRSGNRSPPVPGKTTPDPAERKRHREYRRSIDIKKKLYGISPDRSHSPGNILESDMAKILRKTPHKRSD